MFCEKCHYEICVYVGATVGGYKLYTCPKCGTVYCPEVKVRYIMKEKSREKGGLLGRIVRGIRHKQLRNEGVKIEAI